MFYPVYIPANPAWLQEDCDQIVTILGIFADILAYFYMLRNHF